MERIRYPSLLGMKEKLALLESEINKIPELKIIVTTQSIISISDDITEYEYNLYEEMFEE